jgi:hypothetical protein
MVRANSDPVHLHFYVLRICARELGLHITTHLHIYVESIHPFHVARPLGEALEGRYSMILQRD